MSHDRTLADADARRRIAEDLGATLVVEAAAGTGKTTALVGRLLALVATGTTTLGRVVAVTFTEKAAGEMKLRLRTEIDRARSRAADAPEIRARLDLALAELETAHVGTIHGLCAELLRERPLDAGIDPLFEVAAEEDADRLFDEAFDAWFQACLASPPEGVARVLRRPTRGRPGDRDDSPREVLRAAARKLVETRDFRGSWRRPPLDRPAELGAVVEALRPLAALGPLGYSDNWLAKGLIEIGRFLDDVARRRGDGPEDFDALEAGLRTLASARHWNWQGGRSEWYARREGLRRVDVLAKRSDAKALLDATLERTQADLAACLFEELGPVLARYETLKAQSGKLDFLDLLLATRRLLAESAPARRDLAARFSHLVVDEFQDTDPLQADILFLLAASDPELDDPARVVPVPGKLFVVGDPKQSIYRFRRADVALYARVKARLVAAGGEVLHLRTSFRSAPSLQAFVNAAFGELMTETPSGSQAAYVPLAPFRDEPTGRPTVVALPVPRPWSDYGKLAAWGIEASYAEAVGAFVGWLVRESGYVVRDKATGRDVPLEARHVCLLFKRFSAFGEDATRPYVRALEARRLPHVLVGGRSFHEREEVLAVRAVLAAVEWPDDALSVYATLRGPFFALADGELLAYRARRGHLSPLAPAPAPDAATPADAPVDEALDLLLRLHRRRNTRPVAETLAELLAATRAHAGVALWPSGEQALANLGRLFDLARRHELRGGASFRAFVAKLSRDAARGAAQDAPVVEESTDGVRMMTVHRAKGLEFPVVVLVDPMAPGIAREPSRYVDPDRALWATPLAGAAPRELVDRRAELLEQDREEWIRLLYVATTRARDLLVVPVVGDADENGRRLDGWLAPLDEVVYPRTPDAPLAAEGVPAFGTDTVVERTERARPLLGETVRPGAHVPRRGEHRVVFWDPSVLALEAADVAGQRRQEMLAPDPGGGHRAAEGQRRHEAWAANAARVREDAARPTERVATVTAKAQALTLPGSAVPALPEVTVEHVARPGPRAASGKRFGVLVHAALATCAFDADADAIARAVALHARVHGASEAERTAAEATVAAALAHPLLRAAARDPAVLREAHVVARDEAGDVLEGVVDLAFVDAEGALVVVDFKTDTRLGDDALATYRAQVGLYADVLGRARALPARGVLLVV